MGKFLLAVVAVTTATAFAAGEDDARKKYVEESARQYAVGKEARAKAVERLEAELGEAAVRLAAEKGGEITGVNFFKKDAKTGKYTVRHASPAAKKIAVERAEANIAADEKALDKAKAAVGVGPPLLAHATADASRISVGMIGLFSFNDRGPMQGKISEIIDGNNMLVRNAKYTLWVEAPTKGLVDNKEFAFSEIYEVAGTKKHFGQTMYHFRPFALTDKELKAIRDAK